MTSNENQLQIAQTLYLKHYEAIKNEIKAWIELQLGDNDGKYDDVTNTMTVHDISIEEIEILLPAFTEVATDDENLTVKLMSEAKCNVRLTIDNEEDFYYTIKEESDKEELEYNSTILGYKFLFEIPIQLSLEIENDKEFYDGYAIESINDGKGLKKINNNRLRNE